MSLQFLYGDGAFSGIFFCVRPTLCPGNLFKTYDQDVFNRLAAITFLPDIDIASRLNAQLDQFVSWHPEPGALAVDAFSISWSNQKFYAFLPFSLLTRVLGNIRNDVGLVLCIAPTWSTQP